MRIDKEILSEKNYEGTRMIYLEDEKIVDLKKQLNAIQEIELNPILDTLQDEFKAMDDAQAKIQVIRDEIKELLEEVKPQRDELTTLTKDYTAETEVSPEVEALSNVIKECINKVEEKDAQIKEITKSVEKERKTYEEKRVLMDEMDQRASLIKDKATVMVNDMIKDQLGEFERALNFTLVDDKIQVEVEDRIEELVKSIRASK